MRHQWKVSKIRDEGYSEVARQHLTAHNCVLMECAKCGFKAMICRGETPEYILRAHETSEDCEQAMVEMILDL